MINQANIKIESVDINPDFGGRKSQLVRIVVEDDKGTHATAFVQAVIKHGRVQFELTVLKSDLGETIKTAMADWLL